MIQKYDLEQEPDMTDEEADYQANKWVENWENSDQYLETEW